MGSGEVVEEQECGYVYDHDAETTYEDADVIQWTCRRCGAEGWEDLDTDALDPPTAGSGGGEGVRAGAEGA